MKNCYILDKAENIAKFSKFEPEIQGFGVIQKMIIGLM